MNPTRALRPRPIIRGGFEPVVLLAQVQHDLQAADPQDQQAEADQVDACLGLLCFLAEQETPHQKAGADGHGDVDQED